MRRVVSAFFLLFFITAAFFLLREEEDFQIQTPLPQIFGEQTNEEIDYVNEWFVDEVENKNSQDIFITAKSAIVANFNDGEVLFAKNANEKLTAASTIKIMTSLVVMENVSLDTRFTVSKKAAEIGENSMYLSEGEIVSVRDLLYGLMLVSGNDAAITLAEGVAGSEEKFVEIMNGMSVRLGLVNTKFINSNGLQIDDEEQFTTVGDLATIARYVWDKYPEFQEIVGSEEKYIEATAFHKDYLLYNDTNLLTTYPGVKGIKLGFTREAGLCLVSIAENEGEEIISVILGSDDRRGEMVLLLDHGFEKYGINIEHPGLNLQI